MSEQQAKVKQILDALPGLKEDELVALGPCAVCGKKLLETQGAPLFYIVSIRRAGWDRSALQARTGMAMMMQSDTLARVMGPNRDLAKVIAGPDQCAVHEECADKIPHLLELMRKE